MRIDPVISINVIPAKAFDAVETVLAGIASDLVRAMVGEGYVRGFDVAGKLIEIELALGGRAECVAWGAPPEVPGLFALRSPDTVDPLSGASFVQVAQDLTATVNVEVAAEVIASGWTRDGTKDAEALRGWLAQVVGTMLDVLEWIRETGGMTPDEVFVAGGGTAALDEVRAAVSARLAVTGAESLERGKLIVGWLTEDGIGDMTMRVDAAIEPSAIPTP